MNIKSLIATVGLTIALSLGSMRELYEILPLLALCYEKAYNIINDEGKKEVDFRLESAAEETILEENLGIMAENLKTAIQYFLSYYEQGIKSEYGMKCKQWNEPIRLEKGSLT